MKSCPNCRCIHPDEYNGTCEDCGAPLGGVSANGGGGLQFAYARQIQQGARENALESRMKRGDYDGVTVEPSILDVARNFVVVDKERLKALGGDPNELR